jgi:ribose transport system substrate-binding protein
VINGGDYGMKKVILLLTIIFIIGLIGCVNANNKVNSLTSKEEIEKTKSNDKENKTVALVMKTLTNPFFVEMEKGARKAQSELGINLLVKTGAKETSIEQQIAIVEELINDKVDAIVIAPGSSIDLIPALKKAQDANIKIVNIDNKLDKQQSEKLGLKNVPFISVDNQKGAYLSAKFISDKIKTPTNVAIIEGIRGADNAEQRKIGALKAFNENKNIKIVGSETANWKIDEANVVIEKMFKKEPNIGAVFCANDMMALGVIEYLNKVNKQDVLIAGFDALDEVKSAIKNKKMNVTIDQQADIQGYTGVKYAIDMLNGKEVPAETMIDAKIISD